MNIPKIIKLDSINEKRTNEFSTAEALDSDSKSKNHNRNASDFRIADQ